MSIARAGQVRRRARIEPRQNGIIARQRKGPHPEPLGPQEGLRRGDGNPILSYGIGDEQRLPTIDLHGDGAASDNVQRRIDRGIATLVRGPVQVAPGLQGAVL